MDTIIIESSLISTGATDYWVLSTDYSTYAFVYSCTNLDDEFMSGKCFKIGFVVLLIGQLTS